MTVLMPPNCWNICSPQPTTSARRTERVVNSFTTTCHQADLEGGKEEGVREEKKEGMKDVFSQKNLNGKVTPLT